MSTSLPPEDPGLSRSSRRHNGLPASAYVVLADVDPRVGRHLLDALKESGVAAYLTPTPGPSGLYRPARLPARALERLYVDAQLAERATRVMQAELGVERPADVERDSAADDAAFAALVATWDAPAVGLAPTWPPAEDSAGSDLRDEPDVPRRRRTDSAPTEPSIWRGPTTPADAAPDPDRAPPPRPEPEEVEEHYEPPPPRPLPTVSEPARWAMVSILFGLLVLASPVLLGWELGTGWFTLAVLALLGGAGLLLSRLAPHRDDDSDDGAVV